MKKLQWLVLLLTLGGVFFIVYAPHFTYALPFHVDEWHHISEGLRLGNYGEYFRIFQAESANRFSGAEIGFHFFLFLLSFVTNLVLAYKFLPALWAVFSAAAIFYVVYKKSDNNFLLSWLTVLFFASLKSNVNLLGLWFFTPLTFVLPLILLYVYFFDEGLKQLKTNYLLISLGLMAVIVPTHSLSLFFALPFLVIFTLLNWKSALKKWPIMLAYLILPVLAIFFYQYILNIPWSQLPARLGDLVTFRHGWGILELGNSLTEVYSLTGYILAIIGIGHIFHAKQIKKYSIFLLWLLSTAILILIYRTTGNSYLSPYQRNVYYLAIALPIFSALGLYWLIRSSSDFFGRFLSQSKKEKRIPGLGDITIKLNITQRLTVWIIRGLTALIIIITIFLTFGHYYRMPVQVGLYHVLEKDDYSALLYLAPFATGKIMATPFVSCGVYPIMRLDPVGSLPFYGHKDAIRDFFISDDCSVKTAILKQENVNFIVSPSIIDCGYRLIFKNNSNYIYAVDKP